MKPKNNPLITIIIPAYNAEKYLGRALSSALWQTYGNVEIIVIDDGSTDNTVKIAKSFGDSRVRYFYQENRGQGAARNVGIRISGGDYITFLDADDLYLPEKVERQVRFLQECPEYKIVYCNALHFFAGKPDKLFKTKYHGPSGDLFRDLLHSSVMNPNTVMMDVEVLKKGILFREDKYWPEEWNLYLQISRAGFKFGYLDADLVIVESREDSNTTWDMQWLIKRNALKMFEELFAQMSDNERESFGAGKVLSQQKAKLAVACLAAGSRAAWKENMSPFIPRRFERIVETALALVPFSVVRGAIVGMWKMKQRRSFRRITHKYHIENLFSQNNGK